MSNLIEQAQEIVYRMGNCPRTTLGGNICQDCFYKKIKGTLEGCNADNALKLAQDYLLKVESKKCSYCGFEKENELDMCPKCHKFPNFKGKVTI